MDAAGGSYHACFYFTSADALENNLKKSAKDTVPLLQPVGLSSLIATFEILFNW